MWRFGNGECEDEKVEERRGSSFAETRTGAFCWALCFSFLEKPTAYDMATRRYITVEEFSRFHGLERTFIREFVEFGLVEVHLVDEEECLPAEDLERVERLTRLYRELGINKEGIDIILNLRDQLIALQAEKEALQYRLQQLEQEHRQLLRSPSSPRTYIIDIEAFDL